MALKLLAWTASGLTIYTAAFVASVVAVWVLVPADTSPPSGVHGLRIASVTALWGILSLAGVALITTRLFDRHPVVTWRAIAFCAAGVAVATLLELAMYHWIVVRFPSHYDDDLEGLNRVLPNFLIAISTSSLAQFFAPPSARLPAKAAVLLASAGALAVALANIPGALDGIRATALPLASVLAFSSLYVVAAAARALGLLDSVLG